MEKNNWIAVRFPEITGGWLVARRKDEAKPMSAKNLEIACLCADHDTAADHAELLNKEAEE